MKITTPSRRTFLKLSGSALLAASIGCKTTQTPYTLVRDDDLHKAHQMFGGLGSNRGGAPPFASEVTRQVDKLIVGAGIAGLTAAHTLRDRNPVICELGKRPGGSASYGEFEGLKFAQGAHYELEQPAAYGSEVLELLESLDIMSFNATRNMWEFRDQQFVIDPKWESRCLAGTRFRAEVLPNTPERDRFLDILQPFVGRMLQPTRLIDEDLRYLDTVDFASFLQDAGLPLLDRFRRALDYQMRDDYGAVIDDVSALAGIHYYCCRPYYFTDVRVFSPPQGNGYFVDAFLKGLSPDQVLTEHLITRITPDGDDFVVDGLSLTAATPFRWRAKNVVYAGHKHGLKHVSPQAHTPFGELGYAPWLVMNLIIEDRHRDDVFWQNEILAGDPHFLGFVNSMVQGDTDKKRHVLTAYYCFPPSEKRRLMSLSDQELRAMVDTTISLVERGLERSIVDKVRRVHVKFHGHGMPIPTTNYLFRNANDNRPFEGLVYAGVDNGRLPLIFEAMDSGLDAAGRLS